MAGDVKYSDAHVTARNHDYIDITAAWFDYDDGLDEVVHVLRVVNGEGMNPPPGDWIVYCETNVGVYEAGLFVGRLRFGWTWIPGSPQGEPESRVDWFADERNQSVAGLDKDERLPHSFGITSTEPGYYVFRVDRAAMQIYGQRIGEPRVNCIEEYSAASQQSLVYFNEDDAGSDAVFELSALRRHGSNETELGDGVDGSSSGDKGNASDTVGVSGVTAGATAGSIVALACWRRTHSGGSGKVA